jgi:hypothetical protein
LKPFFWYLIARAVYVSGSDGSWRRAWGDTCNSTRSSFLPSDLITFHVVVDLARVSQCRFRLTCLALFGPAEA